MKPQVIYYSRKGSTKKIADAIAKAIDVTAEDVKSATLQKQGLLFLGSGCYGSKPNKKMIEFLKNHDFTNRTIALFGTSGGGKGQALTIMEQILTKKGANIKGKYFCKGQFGFINRSRPNSNEIKAAQTFAKDFIKHWNKTKK